MSRFAVGTSAIALGLIAFALPAPLRAAPTEIGSIDVHDVGTAPAQYDARSRTVITRAEFEARGAHTVADALRYAPGVAILSYGPFGTTSSVSVDGSNQSAQLLVLLDGIPLNLGSTGAADIATFPLAGIERIEITRGGASTLYGSGAVAGVINLITGRDQGTQAAIAHGSFNDTDLRIATGVQAGTGSLNVAAERHTAGNDFAFPSAASFGSQSGYLADSRHNSDSALSAARVVYDSAGKGSLAYHALIDVNTLRLGVAGGESFLTPSARENSNHLTAGASAVYTHGRATTTLALSAANRNDVYSDSGANYNPSVPANVFGQDSTLDRRVDLQLRHGVEYRNSEWLTGVNLTRETADVGIGLANLPGPAVHTAALQSQTALYTQVVHHYTNGSRFYIGVRGENDHPNGGSISPALGGTLSLSKAYSLHAEASESYRVPTLTDLYYPGFSNPQLVPERSRTFSAGVTATNILGGLSINTFSRTAHNLIALDANFVPQNITHASIQGLQEEIATPVSHGTRLRANFTQTFKALNTTNAQNPARLAYVPATISTFTLEHPMVGSHLGFGVDGNIYGAIEQYSGPAASGFTTIDSFIQLPLHEHAVLSLRADNIGDERYEIVSGYPMPGRSFEVELATH